MQGKRLNCYNPGMRPQPEKPPRPTRRYRALLFQAYLLLAILGFAVLAFFARTTAYLSLDLWVTRHFQDFNPGWFAWFMEAVSWPGFPPQSLWIVSLVVLPLLYFGYIWEGLSAGLAAATAGLLNLLVKLVVQRPRPDSGLVEVIEQLASYSFPSGHVMFYTVFFGFLALLAFSFLHDSRLRTTLLLFCLSMILLVGPSRIYLGQHWASDVLGGYLLGSLWLVVVIQLYLWGRPRFFPHSPPDPESPGLPPGEGR